ncbi:TasA family protein [Halosimplex aquaticum]|uniref:TasA family protein n=1 Tax=Halosimplex aquaticum TaxID=3026162 RepID=A0ABD5YB64_9EURY|nr:TasA family protein [Halosimplex aquaticum]
MSDDESKIELNRRRVLGGIVTVGAAAAAAGAGTFAYFSDSEASNDNQVSAGTLDLTPESGSLATFAFSEVKPGATKGPHSWTLNNAGSIDGSLDVDVTVNNNSGVDDGSSGTPANSTDVSESDLAKAIEVTTLSYGGADITGQISGSTTGPSGYFTAGSSYTSLYDLANNTHADGSGDGESDGGNDLIDLADPGSGTDFKIAVKLRSEAGNDFQADGLDVAFTFMLNQNGGQ